VERKGVAKQVATGGGKSYDAANFGLFKQNWGVLRACAWRYGFKGQPESNWNNGNRLK
jgi:hypothetical protein